MFFTVFGRGTSFIDTDVAERELMSFSGNTYICETYGAKCQKDEWPLRLWNKYCANMVDII